MSSLFDWFANIRKTEAPLQKQQEREIADGLWTKCNSCNSVAYTKDLQANQLVCPECNYHNRVESSERIKQLIDPNTWKPLDENIQPIDPLKFRDRKDYSARLQDYQAKTGLTDAVQTGTGLIDGLPVALGVMDFGFMGGEYGIGCRRKALSFNRTGDSRTISCRSCLFFRWGKNAGRFI